jgi:hypothetical protein
MATDSNPTAWAVTLQTTAATILQPNPSRQALVFYNPGPGAVAICPTNLSNAGTANLTPSIGGAGSITLQANGTAVFDTLPCTAAWQGVSAVPNAPLTIYEA